MTKSQINWADGKPLNDGVIVDWKTYERADLQRTETDGEYSIGRAD